MKRILFPTDFSDASKNAREMAFKIAIQTGAILHVIHTLNSTQQYIDLSFSGAGNPSLGIMDPNLIMNVLEKQHERAKEEMTLVEKRAQELNVTIVSHIDKGMLHEVMKEYVEQHEIGLIVIGTHGASGFREAFIGSNAQRIVRHAEVPVLSVKDNVEVKEINKIMYASDFLEEKINDFIPNLLNVARFFDAELKLVFINTPTYFEETFDTHKRLRVLQEKYGFDMKMFEIYNDFNIEDGIMHYAANYNVDLISLITHGFGGIKKLISDNITETIVNHAKLPVLSYRC